MRRSGDFFSSGSNKFFPITQEEPFMGPTLTEVNDSPAVPSGALSEAVLTPALRAELVEFRRDLHSHPELGRQEFRTTEKIKARLEAAGLEPRVLPAGTGLVCDIGAADPARPRLALRADIDALPVPDTKTVEYRSTVEGRAHACGHDVHTTVTLGAGLVLAEL